MKKQLLIAALLLSLLLTACGAAPSGDAENAADSSGGNDLCGLAYQSTLPLTYATQFSVDYYEGGFKLISVSDGRQYLLIPEGQEAPEDLDSSICRIRMPIHNIYLAATSAMALFNALDGLDAIRLSGTQAEGWTIDAAVEAMNNGDIIYAGKYSEPDYEMLIDEDCSLAIESTMILHSPKVQEMIELLGVPVFIERSSYETHPLGRTEWIKVYGAMLDKEEEASAFFDQQAAVAEEMAQYENTEKTVAFFYISTNGNAVVRSSNDYVPKMIELAGGRYIFNDLVNEENNRSSLSITMEQFYNAAVDADYLIYNADIDSNLDSLDDLLAKNSLFADFKAVKNGNVWYTGKQFYQATDSVAEFIVDVHHMLAGEDDSMTFLTKLN